MGTTFATATPRMAELREGARVWKVAAAVALALAALSGLGYAGWLLTARRGMFAEIAAAAAADTDSVPLSAARSSDTVDAVWLTTTAVLFLAALLLWLVARLLTGRRLGAIGFAGVTMVGVGFVVVTTGSLVASLVGDEPVEAGRAALGYAVVGAGFLLMSLGLLAGLVSLFVGREAYLGYAGWKTR